MGPTTMIICELARAMRFRNFLWPICLSCVRSSYSAPVDAVALDASIGITSRPDGECCPMTEGGRENLAP